MNELAMIESERRLSMAIDSLDEVQRERDEALHRLEAADAEVERLREALEDLRASITRTLAS